MLIHTTSEIAIDTSVLNNCSVSRKVRDRDGAEFTDNLYYHHYNRQIDCAHCDGLLDSVSVRQSTKGGA